MIRFQPPTHKFAATSHRPSTCSSAPWRPQGTLGSFRRDRLRTLASVRAGRLKGNVKEHLARFCDGLGLEIMSYGGGWIPMGGPIKRMVDDNVLAVGDAAGLVMPSNGGGISQAIISGVFAAETGSAHLKEGTSLGRYEDRVRSSMGPALRNSLRSKRMAYLMMHGDLLTDVLLRILGPIGGIRRAMECGRPLYVL